MNKLKLSLTAQKIYDACKKHIEEGNKELAQRCLDKMSERLARFEDAMQYDEYSQEYANENYRCTRNAYYSIETDDIKYGYSVYEWTGATKTMPSPYEAIAKKIDDPKIKKLCERTYQVKEWREILHSTSTERHEMNQAYIDDTLKLLDSLKKNSMAKKENPDAKE